jgi:protein-tyrosine phosphatase
VQQQDEWPLSGFGDVHAEAPDVDDVAPDGHGPFVAQPGREACWAMVADRVVPLTGAFNFRDLGGYPTADGHSTRWGVAFRSDALHELTVDDLVLLRDLGLRTVVDLRTGTELERHGRGLLIDEPVSHVHLSVLPIEAGESLAAPPPVGTDMAARYLWYLEVGSSALAAALRLLADPASQPLVFHCAAGKDRTGVLSALALSCLGVGRDGIVDDYVQTAARLDLILERLRGRPLHQQEVRADPRVTIEAATMERFLDGLDERYGGATGWALSAGIEVATIVALRQCLLE